MLCARADAYMSCALSAMGVRNSCATYGIVELLQGPLDRRLEGVFGEVGDLLETCAVDGGHKLGRRISERVLGHVHAPFLECLDNLVIFHKREPELARHCAARRREREGGRVTCAVRDAVSSASAPVCLSRSPSRSPSLPSSSHVRAPQQSRRCPQEAAENGYDDGGARSFDLAEPGRLLEGASASTRTIEAC